MKRKPINPRSDGVNKRFKGDNQHTFQQIGLSSTSDSLHLPIYIFLSSNQNEIDISRASTVAKHVCLRST